MTKAPAARRPPLAVVARSVLLSPFLVGSLARVGVQLLAFGTIMVVAQHLDLERFGLFAFASAAVVLLTTLLYTGFYEFVIRSADPDGDRDTTFWLLAAVGCLGGLAMGAAAAAAARWASDALPWLFLGLAPVPVMAAPAAWSEALLIRVGRLRTVALVNLAAEALGFAVLVAALAADEGLGALVWARLSASAAAMIVKMALARAVPSLSVSRNSAARAVRAATPLYLTSLTNLFGNYGVDLVLGLVLSPAAVGAYRAGSRVANTGNDLVLRPMHAISWWRFAALERAGDRAGMRAAWLQQTGFLAAVAWPAMAVLALYSRPLVELLLAPGWAAAAPVVAVLAGAHALGVLRALAAPALVCGGRPGLLVRVDLAAAALLLLLLLPLAAHGPVHAAAAQVAARAVTVPVTLVLIAGNLAIPFRRIAAALAPGAALAAACTGLVLLLERVTPPWSASQLWIGLAAVAVLWGAAFAALLMARLVSLPEAGRLDG